MAQSVEHLSDLGFGSGRDLRAERSSPVLCSMLSRESAWRLSPSAPPHAHALSCTHVRSCALSLAVSPNQSFKKKEAKCLLGSAIPASITPTGEALNRVPMGVYCWILAQLQWGHSAGDCLLAPGSQRTRAELYMKVKFSCRWGWMEALAEGAMSQRPKWRLSCRRAK